MERMESIRMIKLIATDMDGTLLDDSKNLPKDFYRVLDALESMGVTFVVASGRSYIALERVFKERSKSMDFICDNGASVVMHGKPIYTSVIDSSVVKDVVTECSRLDDVHPVLCSMGETFYGTSVRGASKVEIDYYYGDHTDVEDLTTASDGILKVAVCDLKNPLEHSYPVLRSRFGEDFSVQVSGKYWLDIMNRGVDKGVGLKAFQDRLGISVEETMAFGDFYNDIPLLDRAYYSYVMDNANDDMKSHGRFIAERNSEGGVVKAICSSLNVSL